MGDERNVIRPSAAAVISDGKGKVLVGRRHALDKDLWIFPGGGIEFCENSDETAVREVKEETGLSIKTDDFLGVFEMIMPKEGIHRLVFFYSAHITEGKETPGGDILELRWLRPSEIELMGDLGDATLPALKMAKLI